MGDNNVTRIGNLIAGYNKGTAFGPNITRLIDNSGPGKGAGPLYYSPTKNKLYRTEDPTQIQKFIDQTISNKETISNGLAIDKFYKRLSYLSDHMSRKDLWTYNYKDYNDSSRAYQAKHDDYSKQNVLRQKYGFSVIPGSRYETKGGKDYLVTIDDKTQQMVYTPAEQSAAKVKEYTDAQEVARKVADKGLQVNDIWSNPVTHGIGKGFMWTMDKISRPLYGVNNMRKYLYALDDDKHEGNMVTSGAGPIGLLTQPERFLSGGATAADSLDDIRFKDAGGLGKAFWEGFSGHEKTLNSDVIQSVASQDDKDNFYDSKGYRVTAGLAGDVLYDPTTYVGVGLVKNIAKGVEGTAHAVRGVEETQRIASLASRVESARVPRTAVGLEQEGHVTANEAYALLGGYLPRRYQSRAAQLNAFEQVGDNMKSIQRHFDSERGITKASRTRKVNAQQRNILAIQKQATILKGQRTKTINKIKAEVIDEEYARRIAQLDETGELSDIFEGSVTEDALHNAFMAERTRRSPVAAYERYKSGLNEGDTPVSFKTFSENMPDFHQSLGESWLKSNVLDEADRKVILQRYRRSLTPDSRKKYKGLQVQSKVLQKNLDRAKKDFEVSETGLNRQRVIDAQKKLNINYDLMRPYDIEAFSTYAKHYMLKKAHGDDLAEAARQVNPDRMAQLDVLQQRVDEALSGPARSHVVASADNTATRDAELVDNVDEFPEADLNLADPLAEDTRFFDSHQQAEAVQYAIDREIQQMVGPSGKVTEGPLTPVGIFAGKNPEVLLSDFLSYDAKKDRAIPHVNRTFNGRSLTTAERDYLRSASEEITKRAKLTTGNRINNAKRGARRVIEDAVKGDRKKSTFEWLKDFKPDKADVAGQKIKQLYSDVEPYLSFEHGVAPRVKVDGKYIVLSHLNKQFAEQIKPYVTQGVRTRSGNYAEMLRAIVEAGNFGEIVNKYGKTQLDGLARALQAAGKDAPSSGMFLESWIKKNASKHPSWKGEGPIAGLRSDDLAFYDLFADKTGMTVGELNRKWKRASYWHEFSNVDETRIIDSFGKGEWFREWPDGMSKRDFIADMTESAEGVYRALNGSRIKFYDKKLGIPTSRVEYVNQRMTTFPEGGTDDEMKAWYNVRRKFNQQYADIVWKALNDHPDEWVKKLDGVYDSQLKHNPAGGDRATRALERDVSEQAARDKHAVKDRAAGFDEATRKNQAAYDALSAKEQAEIGEEEFHRAMGAASRDPESLTRLTGERGFTFTYKDEARAGQIKASMERQVKDRKAALNEQLKDAQNSAVDESVKIQEINAKLADLDRKWANAQSELKRVEGLAVRAGKVMDLRLKENALFDIMDATIQNPQYRIGLTKAIGPRGHAVKGLSVPVPDALIRSAQYVAERPIISATRQIFAKNFGNAATLPGDLQLARHRALSNTPQILSMYLDDINRDFGNFNKHQRSEHMRGWMHRRNDGVGHELNPLWEKHYESLLPYFSNKVKVGTTPLSVAEIQRFLPEKFQLVSLKNADIEPFIHSPQGLARLLNRNSGQKNYDPLEVLWNTRIAVEQALAYKALTHTINEAFGVKRFWATAAKEMGKPVNGKVYQNHMNREINQTVERFKELGWKTVERLGNTHYFPPEMARHIERVLDMTDPRHRTAVGKFIDRITGIWKQSATVPNPGYYTRNLVGEVMSGWLGGVNNPKYYRTASRVQKYMRGDGNDIENLKSVLKEHYPWAAHLKSGRVGGGELAATMPNGTKLSYRDLVVLYHDQGLRTGFLNTEFANRAEFKGFGNSAFSQGYEKVRHMGEYLEDWPRMAHFIHALEHAPKGMSLENAAHRAAGEVRKFHFDYGDLSKFEKLIMMRVFPFYIWTRKALPLMSTMLFTHPGKMTMYPKAMTAVSDMSSDDLITEHKNGFMPTYEGMVPNYIQDMWAYKVGTDVEGKDSYFNLATPQMDSLKFGMNPNAGAYTLMSPFLKVPYELATGQKNLGTDNPYDADGPIKETLDQNPITNYISDIFGKSAKYDSKLTEPGNPPRLDERTVNFITGLGTYENWAGKAKVPEGEPPVSVD